VDLTWTAEGTVTRMKTNNHHKFPGCHINEKFTHMTRTGVAYGSVSDGEMNFTPSHPGQRRFGSSRVAAWTSAAISSLQRSNQEFLIAGSFMDAIDHAPLDL